MPCPAAGLRQIDTAEKQHEFFVISRSNRDAPSPVNGRLKDENMRHRIAKLGAKASLGAPNPFVAASTSDSRGLADTVAWRKTAQKRATSVQKRRALTRFGFVELVTVRKGRRLCRD